jgi:hypothetical protein
MTLVYIVFAYVLTVIRCYALLVSIYVILLKLVKKIIE